VRGILGKFAGPAPRDDAAAAAAPDAGAKRLAALEAAIEHAPVAIAVYDEADVLVVHNSAYETIYDALWPKLPKPVAYADLVRASLTEAGFAGDLEAEVKRRVAVQRNGTGKQEDRNYADGSWRRVSKLRTADGLVAGYALDITELRQREQQLEANKAEFARLARETVPAAVTEFTGVAEEMISANIAMKTLVGETSERAVATGASAEELAFTINHVAASMRETADGAAASSREAVEMQAQMRRLAEALGKVEAFADLIRGIAGQTNLLALNATIEAARARRRRRGDPGADGRGWRDHRAHRPVADGHRRQGERRVLRRAAATRRGQPRLVAHVGHRPPQRGHDRGGRQGASLKRGRRGNGARPAGDRAGRAGEGGLSLRPPGRLLPPLPNRRKPPPPRGPAAWG
jgi:predicted secreted protein